MNKTEIKKRIANIIAEAIKKECWITHPGKGITLSPLSLKNNTDDGKYLFETGWMLVPLEDVVEHMTKTLELATKNFDDFLIDVESNKKFAESLKNTEQKPEPKIILLPGTQINNEEIIQKHTDKTIN